MSWTVNIIGNEVEFLNPIGLKNRIVKPMKNCQNNDSHVFLASGMWLPPALRSVVKILIQQLDEIPPGQPENPQQQQQ